MASLTKRDIELTREQVHKLADECMAYFTDATRYINEQHGDFEFWRYGGDEIWNKLEPMFHKWARDLILRLKEIVLKIAADAQNSPLLSDADQNDLRTNMRRMSAALHFSEILCMGYGSASRRRNCIRSQVSWTVRRRHKLQRS